MQFTFDDIPTIRGSWADETEPTPPPPQLQQQQSRDGEWIRDKKSSNDVDCWTEVPIRKAYRRPMKKRKA